MNDNVLIGASATILGNISIGKGAQVAAGSLVLKNVPPRTMVAGSPAKEVGKVTGELCTGYPLPTVTHQRKHVCEICDFNSEAQGYQSLSCPQNPSSVPDDS